MAPAAAWSGEELAGSRAAAGEAGDGARVWRRRRAERAGGGAGAEAEAARPRAATVRTRPSTGRSP